MPVRISWQGFSKNSCRAASSFHEHGVTHRPDTFLTAILPLPANPFLHAQRLPADREGRKKSGAQPAAGRTKTETRGTDRLWRSLPGRPLPVATAYERTRMTIGKMLKGEDATHRTGAARQVRAGLKTGCRGTGRAGRRAHRAAGQRRQAIPGRSPWFRVKRPGLRAQSKAGRPGKLDVKPRKSQSPSRARRQAPVWRQHTAGVAVAVCCRALEQLHTENVLALREQTPASKAQGSLSHCPAGQWENRQQQACGQQTLLRMPPFFEQIHARSTRTRAGATPRQNLSSHARRSTPQGRRPKCPLFGQSGAQEHCTPAQAACRQRDIFVPACVNAPVAMRLCQCACLNAFGAEPGPQQPPAPANDADSVRGCQIPAAARHNREPVWHARGHTESDCPQRHPHHPDRG